MQETADVFLVFFAVNRSFKLKTVTATFYGRATISQRGNAADGHDLPLVTAIISPSGTPFGGIGLNCFFGTKLLQSLPSKFMTHKIGNATAALNKRRFVYLRSDLQGGLSGKILSEELFASTC